MSALYDKKENSPEPSQGGRTVTIVVPSGKEFAVHAHLPAQYSEYFRRALNSQPEEAKAQRFSLDEPATEETVSLFVDWIYTRSCGGLAFEDLFSHRKEGDILFSCLLGEYIQAEDFQLEVIQSLGLLQLEDFDSMVKLWDAVSPDSIIRLVLVKLFCNVSKRLVTGFMKLIGKAKPMINPASGFGLSAEIYQGQRSMARESLVQCLEEAYISR
ncbi:hypothetical protein F4774DRAFT_426161 [Daldinia eschscholtzii]|nr:hypothetical protein F4774DRAFT_426161 [Daldinia eschscholtzii]